MPAPAVFEDGDINPLPKGPPPVSYDDFRMLYATDRKPSDDPDERPFYLNEPGYIVRLGHARVKAGPAGVDWETVRRTSLAKNRTRKYPLEVQSVNETGALASTYSFLTRSAPGSTAPDQRGKKFAELVNQRLTASGAKDVYVYVHGFRSYSTFPCWLPPSCGIFSATGVPSLPMPGRRHPASSPTYLTWRPPS